MKHYILLLQFSCKNQGKMDLEAAKATVDSMVVN
jgi:hypothetical protein